MAEASIQVNSPFTPGTKGLPYHRKYARCSQCNAMEEVPKLVEYLWFALYACVHV